MELIGQGFSILAMISIALAFQQKKQTPLVIFQMIGGLFFALSYFFLGALSGALLNLLAMVRGLVFLFPKKTRATHPAWLIVFLLAYLAFYVMTFTVFGVEPEPILFVIEFLPVFAMSSMSVGLMLDDSAKVRRCGLIASPAWLTYSFYYGSVGAIVCELFSLASILVGILRHDRRKKQ